MSAQYIKCPNPKCDKKLGPYNADSSSKQRTSGNCPHCGERYTVEYGQGKIKATRN